MTHQLSLQDISINHRRQWRSRVISLITSWAIASGLFAVATSPSWSHAGHPHDRGSETTQEPMPEMDAPANSTSGSPPDASDGSNLSTSPDHDEGTLNSMEADHPELLMQQGVTGFISSPTSLAAVNPTITIREMPGVGELSLGAIVVMPALLIGMKRFKKRSPIQG